MLVRIAAHSVLRDGGSKIREYVREPASNVILMNDYDGSITHYGYDAMNRAISQTDTVNSVSYEYDDAGNLTGRVLNNAFTAAYGYDGLNRLTGISYAHGGNNLPGFSYEYDSAILGTITYDSFGKPLETTGTIGMRFLYTGRDYDADTELYYYRTRWYDPQARRFISEDPIGLNGGINLYAYVRNNPINYIDPYGLYESSVWLRALVPGQTAWDNAVTAFLEGQYGWAAAHTVAMLGEQVFAVVTLGQGVTAGVNAVAKTGIRNVCTTTSGIANSRALGVAGEKAVGITDPKIAIKIGGRTRILDRLTDDILEEVKNVKHLNLTRQLRDFHAFAQQTERSMILYTRPDTTFSKPLQRLIDNGSIIHRHIPGL